MEAIRKRKTKSQPRSLTLFDQERPFLSLREAMNRLFDESFWDPFDLSRSALEPLRYTFFPKVDISETDKEVRVVANIPGIDPKKIEVEASEDSLSLRGEIEEEKEEKGKRTYRLEREYGSFKRELSLPAKVRPEKASASAKNGVLTIILPKAEEEKKKRLKVKAE